MTYYSALHYAAKAEKSATSAANSAAQASQSSGKVIQLGFDGTMQDGVLVFKHAPSGVEVPYELLDDYEYELDLSYDSLEDLSGDVQMYVKNGNDTVTFVSSLHRDSTSYATADEMSSVMRFNADTGYRWLFKAAYKIAPNGTKVFLLYPVISSGGAGAGLEIGDIGFAPLGIDEAQNKRRYLNGQVISQAQFVSFTNKIKSAIELYPNLTTTETNWQAEVTNSKLGQCGKFVIDDTLGTIRLPKVVNIQGLQDLALMGSIKAESLPNITGKFAVGNTQAPSISPIGQGAFVDHGVSGGTQGAAWTAAGTYYDFDASLSSSTYQENAPVQQEAIQYPYFIQVATGVEESVDVTREIELNNPFSLLDYKWSEYEISNASWLISNGTFHSGATYIAVYNLLLEIYNGTVTKDGVSVKMSTEAYEDTDFVLNTTDTTFRLPIKVKLASGNAVVGNGMTLGLSDGTIFNGLASTPNIGLSYLEGAYGTDVGVSANAGTLLTANKSVGVTTDPLKSGIETSSNGLKLYFYVGETIQDANVIAASQVLTTVADSVRKSSAADRETVVGWGMPDYSARISLTAQQLLNGYTAPVDGVVTLTGQATNGSYFLVDNVGVGFVGGQTSQSYAPVEKGSVVSLSASLNIVRNIFFYPLKGVI